MQMRALRMEGSDNGLKRQFSRAWTVMTDTMINNILAINAVRLRERAERIKQERPVFYTVCYAGTKIFALAGCAVLAEMLMDRVDPKIALPVIYGPLIIKTTLGINYERTKRKRVVREDGRTTETETSTRKINLPDMPIALLPAAIGVLNEFFKELGKAAHMVIGISAAVLAAFAVFAAGYAARRRERSDGILAKGTPALETVRHTDRE